MRSHGMTLRMIPTAYITRCSRILVECAARHPNEQCYGAPMAGFKMRVMTASPFSADHPVEKKKVSNLGTKKLSMEA